MKFKANVETAGKTTMGFQVPPEIVEKLGAGKRPPVRVTINGYTYRSTVAPLGGVFMMGLSAENRAGAKVTGPGTIDVDMELDTAPREVTVPPDFAKALAAEPAAKRMFDSLSFSNKSAHVSGIVGAKSDETRKRRIAKSIEALKEGRIR
jgi:bacteriocin resistance YdeI/OmpD-like protein/uncharacterized protein DUF1905